MKSKNRKFFLIIALTVFSIDEVELELDGNPRGELERDVAMGVGAAIAPGLGDDADGTGALNPLAGGED